jgi:SAM-dependent methyltransferase
MTKPTAEQLEQGFIDTWSRAKPPLRPAPGVLAFYDRHLRRALPDGRGRLLILGSTAELRDLALRHGLRPTCADLSPRIWEAMRSLMTERGEEGFIPGNWLDLPEDRPWDLILGDGSLTMMPEPAIEPFLAKLRRLVAPGGTVALRFGARSRSVPLAAFGDAVRRHPQDGGGRTLYEYLAFLINTLRSEHCPEMETRAFVEQKLAAQMSAGDRDTLLAQLWGWRVWLPERAWLDARFAVHFERVGQRINDEPGNWGVSFVEAFQPRPAG